MSDEEKKGGHHHKIAIFLALVAAGGLGVSYFSAPHSQGHHHGGFVGGGAGTLATLTAVRGVLVGAQKLLSMLALCMALALTGVGGYWVFASGILAPPPGVPAPSPTTGAGAK
jgi:hypothetical protein